MKTACTLASPRTLTCANPPIGLVQPKISSIRLRMTWLRVAGMTGDATVYCRPSGLARLGDVTVDRDVWRHLAFTQRFDKLDHVVGFVGAERDPLLGWSMRVRAASRSAVPVACVTSPATAKPLRFSIRTCPR